MPALLPPDMQIGGPEQGKTPSLFAGPAATPGSAGTLLPPQLIQQVALASTVAAPTTFTLSGIASTRVGSTLILGIAYAESGASAINTPAGFTSTAVGSNGGNTLGGRMMFQLSNPGGITSIAFTGLSGINGVAVWLSEWINVYALDGGFNSGGAFQNYSNGTTTPSVSAYTPISGPLLLVGFECDVTGQAYTAANVGPSGWTAGTTATSTTGATNAIIRPFYAVTTPNIQTTYQLKGTLAGSIAAGNCMLSLLCNVGSELVASINGSTVDQGAGYGVSATGAPGWAVGGTKPGFGGGGIQGQ